jgi:(p)ppGpp synthase/HD superfamily hydrolase
MATRSKSPLWQQAAAFAARAHEHQYRRDQCTPYFSHPVRVAMTVACVFGFADDEEILAAALLHDTIEDTGTDYDDILESFGERVADLVTCLTKDMRLIEDVRESAYDQQLAQGPWEARLIKLADVYDNLLDIQPGKSRATMSKKAKRALSLAKNDSELSEARAIVSKLL